MTVALFWDLDGTLLSTGRAGVFALEAAARVLGGANIDFAALKTSGLTDAQVAELSLETCGLSTDQETVDTFLRAYERHLPECLHLRHGGVLPGVREILDDLSGCPEAESFLLTGNTRVGAQTKLAHYGLSWYFARGGGFCEGPGSRDDIARRARALANGASDVFVIGDTPHDVACSRAIDARTIAVATGVHTLAELEACGPWIALPELPPPAEFRRLIRLETL